MDWWRLFGGRDLWRRLIGHRGGYAVPDVRMRFDGDDFEVRCLPRRYRNPALSFPNDATERLKRSDAERVLGTFITAVLERLDATGVRDSGLHIRWGRIQASLEDDEEAAFCEAAGALGLDPYDIPDDAAALIEESGALFQGETLFEFLAGLRTPSTGEAVLNWIRRSEKRPPYKSRLPALSDIRNVAPGSAGADGDRPWARGYRRARAVRRRLGASQAERFTTVSALAKRLDAPYFGSAGPVSGIGALVQSDGRDVRVHLRRTLSRTHNLFAFGRAVGDAVANPPVERSAVNDLHEASRQACGRAFAAEFLAPVDEILSMRSDGLDTDSIADDFGVSTAVVERQIENADRIRQACA